MEMFLEWKGKEKSQHNGQSVKAKEFIDRRGKRSTAELNSSGLNNKEVQ